MKASIYIFIFFYYSLAINGQTDSDSLSYASLKAEDSTTTKITRLNINSNKSDFSPYVFNKQLFFVSGRPKSATVQYIDATGQSEITDIYSSSKLDSIKYTNTKSLTGINTNYYEGPFCFNKTGDIIYFTANDKHSSALKIYSSQKINNNWSKPQLLPFCTDNYSYCHPILSPDESIMVFASDKNKEKNKMDLYMSEYNNGIWSPPIALDKKINDTTNEVFPFIAKNNLLYFSSNKKTGFGGLDIYCVYLDSDTSIIRQLPYPINSTADDFGAWIDLSTESGYFSTNRNTTYGDDIYYFSKNIPDFSNWKIHASKNSFCYTFFEEATLSSNDTLNLTYEWNFGDGNKGRGLRTKHCFNAPGDYTVELNIIDKNSGEVFINETSTHLTIERPDELQITCTDSVAAGEDFLFNTKKCYLKGYELSKMYWSFGDGRYNSGPTVKHIYKKPGSYKIEMGVTAKNLNSSKIENFKVEKNIIVMNK